MLKTLGDEIPFSSVRAVTDAGEIVAAQKQLAGVFVSDAVADYIVAIADASRRHPQLKMGASPRAARGLYRAVKVWAAMDGRDYATPDDVKALAHPVLAHRMVLRSGTRMNGVTVDDVLDEILSSVDPAPSAGQLADE